MTTLKSKDGTTIAFDKQGDGPALILVDGAMGTRSSGSKPELARRLARRLTVYTYHRRGRGESGDTKPYAVDREIEDIDALIDKAGGSAFLYGHSSRDRAMPRRRWLYGGQARGLVTNSMSSSWAEPWTTSGAIPRKSFIASASD